MWESATLGDVGRCWRCGGYVAPEDDPRFLWQQLRLEGLPRSNRSFEALLTLHSNSLELRRARAAEVEELRRR